MSEGLREIEEMMSSYEVEVMPDDFDHSNGNSGKSVEMNLDYDNLVAEYFHSSSSGPWPLRDTGTRRDEIAEFYVTGTNLFSKDKSTIELYPFLLDQIKEDIESQGESIETVSDAVKIHNYDELDEKTTEKLDLIEESIRTAYTDEDEGTIMYAHGAKLEFWRTPEVEIDLTPSGYLEVETEAEVESRTYTNTEEIQRIAGALDPMNFNKIPYEQVKFETDFEYEGET
jgi:hypothetical protein